MKKKIISGIIVTMFLVTMVTFAIPVQASVFTGDPIYIGLVGPMGWIQWDGVKEGAELAQDLINTAGGMRDSGGDTHELKFVEIDEHSVPIADPTAAVTELITALDTHQDMLFLIGGYMGESCFPMREAAMDYVAVHGRPIWIICGASDEYLIDDGPEKDNPYDDVREDYDRYKYMFRSVPMNDSALGNQLFAMAAQLQIPKLKAVYGIPQEGLLPTYLIAEALKWADAVIELLQELATDLGCSVVGVGRPSAIETDFAPILDQIEASGAKLIIHLFGAPGGAAFIKQWGERQVSAVPVGINVESMSNEFYEAVGGKCEYETIVSALGTRTNVNPDAKPLNTVEFWDEYLARYGHTPIYTAWGTYLELMYLNDTAADWIGKTCDEIVPIMEQTVIPNSFLGFVKYTKYHDLYCDAFSMTPIWPPTGWPGVTLGPVGTARAHLPQWQAGKLEVVWPRGTYPAEGSVAEGMGIPNIDSTPLGFARKWKIPSWVYSLGETDFAGGPEILSPPPELAAEVGIDPGFFGSFTSPDGVVDTRDSGVITEMWQDTCAWTVLEADMDGNSFIDIDDLARVALDWGKTA